MHTYSLEINKLKKLIDTKLKHTYINKFIQKPYVCKDKIYIFNNLYNKVNTPWVNKEKLITTIFLIDIALDMHDSIPSQQNDKEMNETELQLSVLAGDYFSSQYYYILSQLEDSNMIALLASVIKKISENKMSLFYQDVKSINEYIQIMKETEALLYKGVAMYLNEPQLIPVVQEYLLIDKLHTEKAFITQGKQTSLLKYLETSLHKVDYLTVCAIIDNEIENSLQKIDKFLIELPYQHIDIKAFMANKLNLNYQKNRSIAEEG